MVRVQPWFWTIVAIHLMAWTLIPWAFRYNLPLDSIEGALWGSHLSWGYDKNPFMNAWLTRLANEIGGQWAIYLFSQIAVGISFFSVFQLGKKMVPPLYALVAVLFLEGMQYYNLHAIDLSDNTIELAVWSLTVLCFYRAVTLHRTQDWLYTGLAAGLAMMTKYYSALLLLSMLLFLLNNTKTRAFFYHRQLYLGLGIFLVVITPHLYWLFHHDFLPIQYACKRTASPPHWSSHFFYPALFIWQQFEVLIPALFLFLFLIGKKQKDHDRIPVRAFDRQFLLWVGVGPLLLTLGLSFVTGIQLRAGWGMPLFSLYGLLLLVLLRPIITPATCYRFMTAVFCFFALTLIGYGIALTQAKKPSSANFPGATIATQLTAIWHVKQPSPLRYVAGNRWLAGNIAYYAPDHPSVFIDWAPKLSPWLDEKTVRKTGALFVWELNGKEQTSYEEIKSRFPNTSEPFLLSFDWMRNPNAQKILIQAAILAPEH